jgi:hypothetical protein
LSFAINFPITTLDFWVLPWVSPRSTQIQEIWVSSLSFARVRITAIVFLHNAQCPLSNFRNSIFAQSPMPNVPFPISAIISAIVFLHNAQCPMSPFQSPQ